MKIAVATNDQQRVTGHIGRCRSFLVYELDGTTVLNKELRMNTFTNHGKSEQHDHRHGEGAGHHHTNLIEGLKDCTYLISSGGGWRVVEDLKTHNITTLFTDEVLIENAMQKFIKGELVHNSGLTCAGHGH